jgi:uncharacterized protein (TIGR02145 family)
MTPTTSFNVCGDLVPYGGKNYHTVQIGSQCWFKENLNIGLMIPLGQNQSNSNSIEKYCSVNDEANCNVFGGLYQWNNMMQWSTNEGVQGICPTGWHIPTDAEWTILTDYLGGLSIAAGELKSTGTLEAGTGLWHEPNSCATNKSGFTGLPGGFSQTNGFYGLFYNAKYWSSTQDGATFAWGRDITYNSCQVARINYRPKYSGFSVRCLKD